MEIILQNKYCPGDILVMEAAIASLHKAFPGEYQTVVASCANAIYDNHPLITAASSNARLIDMGYPAINQSNQRGLHFMQAYCEFLSEQLDIDIPLAVNRPTLYLSEAEKEPFKVAPKLPYVVINAGFKLDCSVKKWLTPYWQEVIDHFKGRLDFVQIGTHELSHIHPELKGVVNMIGQTDHRKLFRICYHSLLGIGGVTYLEHIYAALDRHYILLQTREPLTWLQYPKQVNLHAFGELECSQSACWKSTLVLEEDVKHSEKLCKLPVLIGNEWVAECQKRQTPEKVIKEIERLI